MFHLRMVIKSSELPPNHLVYKNSSVLKNQVTYPHKHYQNNIIRIYYGYFVASSDLKADDLKA